MRDEITADLVRKLFAYDPLTGIVTRRINRCSIAREGAVVGTLSTRGYLRVHIGSRAYQLHRVIWLHVHGRWPLDLIDHINGITADNRLDNLREATHAENSRYKRHRSGCKAPYKGIMRTRSGRWQAQICLHGKNHGLGTFDTPELAHATYVSAAKKFYGAFAKAA